MPITCPTCYGPGPFFVEESTGRLLCQDCIDKRSRGEPIVEKELRKSKTIKKVRKFYPKDTHSFIDESEEKPIRFKNGVIRKKTEFLTPEEQDILERRIREEEKKKEIERSRWEIERTKQKKPKKKIKRKSKNEIRREKEGASTEEIVRLLAAINTERAKARAERLEKARAVARKNREKRSERLEIAKKISE